MLVRSTFFLVNRPTFFGSSSWIPVLFYDSAAACWDDDNLKAVRPSIRGGGLKFRCVCENFFGFMLLKECSAANSDPN